MEEDAEFCGSCGVSRTGPIRNNQNYNGGYSPRYMVTEKSAGVAIVLGFLIVGLGHLYAGRIGRGLVVMAINILIAVPAYIFLFTVFLEDIYMSYDDAFTWLVLLGLLMIVQFIYLVWTLYDVNKLVKQYNEHARRTGEPLW